MLNKRSIAGIILAGTIAITGSGTAFAVKEENPLNNSGTSTPAPFNPEQIQMRLKGALDSLVKDGTITQEQETAVLKAMKEKREEFEKARLDKRNENKETLNKEKEKLEKGNNSIRKPFGRKHGVLKDLVKDGTLTPEQADAIRKVLKSEREKMTKPEEK